MSALHFSRVIISALGALRWLAVQSRLILSMSFAVASVAMALWIILQHRP
jgi:hypothetical protein